MSSFATAVLSTDASLYPYPSQIIMPDKGSASVFAHQVSALGHIPRTLVIWGNGSALPLSTYPCAGVITYVYPETFQATNIVAISHLSRSLDAELLAIRAAFEQAASLTEYCDKLVVFSDSKSALEGVLGVGEGHNCRSLVEDISRNSNRLYNEGIDVELHWVPAGANVEEHKLVDHLSRAYRKISGLVAPTELLNYEVVLPPIMTLVRSDAGVIEEVRDVLRKAVVAALTTGLALQRKVAPIQKTKKARKKNLALIISCPDGLTKKQRHQ